MHVRLCLNIFLDLYSSRGLWDLPSGTQSSILLQNKHATTHSFPLCWCDVWFWPALPSGSNKIFTPQCTGQHEPSGWTKQVLSLHQLQLAQKKANCSTALPALHTVSSSDMGPWQQCLHLTELESLTWHRQCSKHQERSRTQIHPQKYLAPVAFWLSNNAKIHPWNVN